MQGSDQRSQRTIVLLGASNLTRALPVVLETLRLQYGTPLRIIAALGLGRSYGMSSRVFGRGLKSILACDLWHALSSNRSNAATRDDQRHMHALITDIGNDIMYGALPQQVIDWLECCVIRLRNAGVQRINLTALPVESIRRVQRWQYTVVKSALFPLHDISYDTAIMRAFQTQALLEQLAERHADVLTLQHHDRRWYGFDPIHIRKRFWPEAWSRFLAEDQACEETRARSTLTMTLRTRLHFPHHFDLFGAPMSCHQPAQVAPDLLLELY